MHQAQRVDKVHVVKGSRQRGVGACNMHCNIGARSIEVNMNPAFCMIFSFLVGAFTGGVVLIIAGNKFMTKQLVAEQTKLDAELVRTKERLAAEKRKRSQMTRDRSERVIFSHDTLGHV
jgi:hypothetical protein